jgi:hypothetical protein
LFIFYFIYSSPSIIRMINSRRMRWVGYVARIREKRNACMLLVGKPKRKRPVGRPRRRSVDNIKMDLGESQWGGVEWIGLAQDRDKVEGCCESGNKPGGSINCCKVLEWLHNRWPFE